MPKRKKIILVTAETKQALAGSIAKWEKCVADDNDCRDGTNCPLCLKFNKHFNYSPCLGLNCLNCPIRQDTNKPHCSGTPYRQYVKSVEEGSAFDDPVVRQHARNMLAYLVDLDKRCSCS